MKVFVSSLGLMIDANSLVVGAMEAPQPTLFIYVGYVMAATTIAAEKILRLILVMPLFTTDPLGASEHGAKVSVLIESSLNRNVKNYAW